MFRPLDRKRFVWPMCRQGVPTRKTVGKLEFSYFPGERDLQKSRSLGFTLLEVLLALSVVVLVAGALLGLSRAVTIGSAYSETVGTTTQHARVVIERISRTVRGAKANANFPGFIVVADQVGVWRFPDTLVVWHPEGSAATDWPLFSELVIYCPHPQEPTWLMEIRATGDTRPAPPLENLSAWQAELASIKASAAASAVRLTDRLRVCVGADLTNNVRRGAVRFEAHYRPSLEQWASYKAGDTAWNALPWAQSLFGPNTGMRQAWLRFEIQLQAGPNETEQASYPFFGSAALYYLLSK